MDCVNEAKKVFNIEIEALEKVRDSLGSMFENILEAIVECKGKVIITGMGKPGHIGKKIAATMASLGTSAFYLHPAEALHGDLGMIQSTDVVIAISYSGESDEIKRLLPNIKAIGATLIAISGKEDSTLVKNSDLYQVFPKFNEACYLNLAPTSSTTAALVYGDALAVVGSGIYGFTKDNFALYHPAGALGKKLFLKVSDLMAQDEKNAIISDDSTLKNAIVELSCKGLGIVAVVDKNRKLLGVITDGDLRRQLEKEVNVYDLTVKNVMTSKPIYIYYDKMAVDALQIFKAKNISGMPVVDYNHTVVGTIRVQDIIAAGIIL